MWLGVSIENQRCCWRRDEAVNIPVVVHFICAEPLLEDISLALSLEHIEWLIVGGESGPKFRPMDHAWARALRDRCQREGDEPGFKTWNAAATGRYKIPVLELSDPASEEFKALVTAYKLFRRQEAEENTIKSRVAQRQNHVAGALTVVTGMIIRRLANNGMSVERTLAGDLKRRINSRKKWEIGEVAPDEETLRQHYQWLLRLERDIRQYGLPSWVLP